MKYCFYRKVWADDPNHVLFNEQRRIQENIDGRQLGLLRLRDDVHTALYIGATSKLERAKNSLELMV